MTRMVLAAVLLVGGAACGMGFILGESKEQLKLQYDIAVQEHSYGAEDTGRVTIVITLSNEGRLAPLEDVQLTIPEQKQQKDGSNWMDLVVSIKMEPTDNGKRVGRVHIRRDMAERASLQLNTHTMDGKMDPLTRLHHVIPIAKYLSKKPG